MRQTFELRLKIIHRLAVVLLARRIKRQVCRRLGRVGRAGGFLGLAVFLLLQRRLRQRRFLQHGILLKFLLHHRLQFKRGRLQQRQRLLQLRGQHLRQRHLLRKM